VSVAYKSVQWNAHKRVYDLVVVGAVVLFLLAYAAVSFIRHSGNSSISPPVLLMRGTAIAAITLLHVILAIGPLARLDARMAPLLYNRRHLGVTMFLLALVHALVAVGFYGLFGPQNPLTAMLASNESFDSISGFPFEVLGLGALLILFVMAATSHDFWLKNLSPAIWKAMHLGVYAAYALVVMHVALGILQSERSLAYPLLLGAGVAVISGLHIVAGFRELAKDRAAVSVATWMDVGSVDEIPESRAKTVCVRDRERVAIFKHEGRLCAVASVCAHQGGPLGEGKIIGGCITCPWHGYQYLPHNGQSPPPFTEKIPTYEVRVEGGRVLLNPEALPPGTAPDGAVGAPHG
jgi:nitrite reductase/ring-hydroxylating ferredoxin subunit/DMSO/TMAO reductase YedYZ heme-binding membrane subunit